MFSYLSCRGYQCCNSYNCGESDFHLCNWYRGDVNLLHEADQVRGQSGAISSVCSMPPVILADSVAVVLFKDSISGDFWCFLSVCMEGQRRVHERFMDFSGLAINNIVQFMLPSSKYWIPSLFWLPSLPPVIRNLSCLYDNIPQLSLINQGKTFICAKISVFVFKFQQAIGLKNILWDQEDWDRDEGSRYQMYSCRTELTGQVGEQC